LGTLIKWNPAIKSEKDRDGLLKHFLMIIDIITTDHAPHTIEESRNLIFNLCRELWCSIPCIYVELYKRGLISLEKIAEKMCHNVAVLYGIEKRIHS
jgi:dihydroorotase